MNAAELQSRTPAGVLAQCEYLIDKGYATAAQINPWRTAVQKVFETVEGEGWESLDLNSVDLADYLSRFRTLAGAQYKAESIVTYGRRVEKAIEAHEQYLTTGRPITFRSSGAKSAASEGKKVSEVVKLAEKQQSTPPSSTPAGLMAFDYPLNDGLVAKLFLPPRVEADDANRLCAFIRTLQKTDGTQRQIPSQTGDNTARAA